MAEKSWGIFHYDEDRRIDLCEDQFFSSKAELLNFIKSNGKKFCGKECYIGNFALLPPQGNLLRVYFSYWAMVNHMGEVEPLGPRFVQFGPSFHFWEVLHEEASVSA